MDVITWHGYKRYDERTSTMLGNTAELVLTSTEVTSATCASLQGAPEGLRAAPRPHRGLARHPDGAATYASPSTRAKR